MSAAKTIQAGAGTELRHASSPGFWEMWIGGQFVGMYYSLERAKQAAASCYATACRGKYGVQS